MNAEKPIAGLPRVLNEGILRSMLSSRFTNGPITLTKMEALPIDNSSSILVTLTSQSSDKAIGHFRYLIDFTEGDTAHRLDTVIKLKPHSEEVCAMLSALAGYNGPPLDAAYAALSTETGFYHSHRKELEIARDYGNHALLPEIYGVHSDDENKVYVILMEYLGGMELLNSVMAPDAWKKEHIEAALDQVAAWHAMHLHQVTYSWPDTASGTQKEKLQPLYRALWENARAKLPDLVTEERHELIKGLIDNAVNAQAEMDTFPKTLIHNDLNPRNSGFYRNSTGLRYVVYDWELASYHIPHYDVAEFLSFVLDEDRYGERLDHIDYYRRALEKHSDLTLPKDEFLHLFYLAQADFCFLRIGMYLMAHALSPYPFLPRVVNSAFDSLNRLSRWA